MGKNRARERRHEKEKANREVRQKSALELRTKGWTYDQIATFLGVSINTVYLDTSKALEEIREQSKELAQEIRDIELRRLDTWLQHLDDKITNGNVPAIRAALKIQERRAKLLGLDAPTPTNVEPMPDRIDVVDPYEDDPSA